MQVMEGKEEKEQEYKEDLRSDTKLYRLQQEKEEEEVSWYEKTDYTNTYVDGRIQCCFIIIQ